ncbi:alpha-L-glutamate ligase [Streptomyces sp. CB01881]|uniref:ATP-grasp domain-containing protein n=1 Tax=Streptomyces sp. CB01881 TaxID=2078691 RepID=UPI000CDC8B9E|nr:alpha-L-glutamate ligase [Streptomyces sp. CB01881]AUY51752.1 alpha-L-glutamate ligase [Streptomyces sp. CB01881]TYC71179.1 alpha-L-glutamate ligase [Streptomyces sp. CB01881]
MRIGLVTPDPGHPLLAATAALLAPDHQVETIDPTSDATPPAERIGPGPPADVYLLKARTPYALALARHLEERGAPVLNSAAATGFCQDRTAMADLAHRAGLPFAATRTAASLADLAGELSDADYPLAVKSRHSRRHDLVARVDGPDRLRALAAQWPAEPVIAQPYLANTGWDQKIWVVDGQVFCERRRSELALAADLPAALAADGSRSGPAGGRFGPADLPADRAELARRVGQVFGLDVYGVDLLDGPAEPVIVDINAFPGIRGQAGAPEALAALALRTARTGGGTPRLPGQRDAQPRTTGR